MINSWKQFAEWVTELKDDPFVRARFKITFLYTLSVTLIFIATEIVIRRVSNGAPVYTLLVLGTLLISYLVGGQSLSPIRQIVRAQKRFIADASHELRTPLAIMKTNSEVALLDGEQITGQEAHTTLKSNLEEMDRMSKIIENLLSLSYYDNRFTEIPFSPVNLRELVVHIANKAQGLALKKSISLEVTGVATGLILGNPTALEQMTINLIKNAVTYTPPNGRVTVEVSDKSQNLELRIKDNGIGIAEKDLPNIFSAFYKAGEFRSQEERGSSGLGLTIVKKIVERHQGTIEIHSKLGKGTTVLVTLPKYS